LGREGVASCILNFDTSLKWL